MVSLNQTGKRPVFQAAQKNRPVRMAGGGEKTDEIR
jgi:hypothetical protein